MADRLGPTHVPATPRVAGLPSGDFLLDVLLSFFRATLNADGGRAWSQVAPGEPLVRTTFAHNPEDVAFDEKDSPALYLWRSEWGKAYQHAEDYWVRPSTLMLAWVMPMADQDTLRRRTPFMNAVHALLIRNNEGPGRHRAWVVNGDTDPQAALLGSLLWNFATVFRLLIGRATPSKISIEMGDDSPARHYPALLTEIDVLERLHWDIAVRGPALGATPVDFFLESVTNSTPLLFQNATFSLP